MGNRERRAAKQRRRDERRGHVAAPEASLDRGLAPETLRALLRRAADDVAAGHEDAVAELRRVLAEHLARRRAEILAACDDVLAESTAGDVPTQTTAADRGGLADHLGAGGTATSWAEDGGHATEDVVTATVELLAARLT